MNKRKKSKIGLILILGIVVYFSWVVIGQQGTLYAQNVEMKNIQDKINKENELSKDLKDQKKILSTDKYAEKIAREKFGMVMPDERVFVDSNR